MTLIKADWYCPHCGARVSVEERTPGYWERDAASLGMILTATGTPICHDTPMVDQAAGADLPPTQWYPQQGITNWSASQERN